MINFPQNCKNVPPKATFHGNEMTKFHIFSMHAKKHYSEAIGVWMSLKIRVKGIIGLQLLHPFFSLVFSSK